MLNSGISCLKVPKLIIKKSRSLFYSFSQDGSNYCVQGTWRGLWIAMERALNYWISGGYFQSCVITRNIQTVIIYYDLQRKSHWMSFLRVLQQSCYLCDSLPEAEFLFSFPFFSEIILFQSHPKKDTFTTTPSAKTAETMKKKCWIKSAVFLWNLCNYRLSQ